MPRGPCPSICSLTADFTLFVQRSWFFFSLYYSYNCCKGTDVFIVIQIKSASTTVNTFRYVSVTDAPQKGHSVERIGFLATCSREPSRTSACRSLIPSFLTLTRRPGVVQYQSQVTTYTAPHNSGVSSRCHERATRGLKIARWWC
jgi:hypothetical protein